MPALIRTTSTSARGWVGVFAAKNPDPKVEFDDSLPRDSIVGAVKISDSVMVTGDPKLFLLEHFGEEVASFYPAHFLPVNRRAHAWLISEAIAADPPRPWAGAHGMLWILSPGTVSGEKLSVLKPPKKPFASTKARRREK